MLLSGTSGRYAKVSADTSNIFSQSCSRRCLIDTDITRFPVQSWRNLTKNEAFAL